MIVRYGSNIWLATALSYLDRGAAFILPLLVLKFNKNQDAYNLIEYIISVSIVLTTFFDAGLKSYLLISAKKNKSDDAAIVLTVGAYKILYVIHVLAILFVIVSGYFLQNEKWILIGLSIARASALSIIGLVVQSLILKNQAAFCSLPSLCNWMLGCSSFFVPEYFPEVSFVTLFFSGSYIIILLALFYGILSKNKLPKRDDIKYLGEALAWSWPLLITAASSMMVANFSKVYAFSSLSSDDILGFNFWMRLFSVIQLNHVAAISILTTQIYASSTDGIIVGNFRRYANYIFVPAVVILCAALFVNNFVPVFPKISSVAMLLLFGYFVVWCLGAYFETYLTKKSKNKLILKSSLMSSVVYLGAMVLARPSNLVVLVLVMMTAAFVYTVFVGKVLIGKK